MSVQENETDRNVSDRQNTKKQKKKYDPIDDYQENYYLDCKDSVNAWCLARIIERCDHDQTLKINFDGWSHKWDEVSFLPHIFKILVGPLRLK